MNEEDMIIPEADAPAGNVQENSEQPAVPAEIEGALLDNDEVEDEQNNDAARANGGNTDTDANGVEKSNDAGTGTGSQDGQADASAKVREEPVQPSANQGSQKPVDQPAAQLEDPGEFTPRDYSFDVELADGSKIRIAKPEDIDNIPADADFGSPKNLMLAQANYSKMVSGLDADKREYDANKESYDKQVVDTQVLEQRVTTMMNEMAYLETKSKLPPVEDKYKEADWSDPEVAKQPGVKERLALLEYRVKENTEREKLGLSPMSVLEASMQMEQDVHEQQARETKEKQNNLRKQKGGMITGASTAPVENLPDDMIVGAGGSIRDIGL